MSQTHPAFFCKKFIIWCFMSDNQSLHIVILAAGRGKRMQTHLPKVLHRLAGQPLLQHVLNTSAQLNAKHIHVVVGHEAEKIQESINDAKINWVYQQEQLGTGHAVMQALPHIPDNANVLVLFGDVPLIDIDTLNKMHLHETQGITLLVANMDNPFGLGRIMRDSEGKIISIVEEKDASTEQKHIKEIFTGVLCAKAHLLKQWLPQLSTNNQQKEYYLTGIIDFAVREHVTIDSQEPKQLFEIQGVNTLVDLHKLERTWQQHLALQLLNQGVHVSDIHRLDIRGTLECASDTFIDINVLIEGQVHIGQNTSIGAHSVLKNCIIGKNCTIHPHSIIQDSVLEDHCEIGPFARLRPGTSLASNCKIGNFVETKNVCFDQGSKASHLSYLGDAEIGKHVNIGAGTITCNYDGVNKHKTIIKDHAFIGSDTQLIAPITVGEHATIGAGTSLRSDAPDNALTLSPNKQRTILGWKRKNK